MNTYSTAFERLVTIMNELREQCPWDKKQTIQTLRHLTIEETYELVDAIDQNDWKGIKEELGDLLLHIVFYAKIGNEQQQFSLDEMINGICDKLVSRHPHIYGDVSADADLKKVVTDADVKENWEKLKLKEGKTSILGGVPNSLPSMVKAIRLQEKSKTVGFEWENTEQVLAKVNEEMAELQEAIQTGNQHAIADEMGDVFFSLVNFARFLQVDADAALEGTNQKFIKRFKAIETAAAAQNKALHDMTLGEMDALWNEIKLKEKSTNQF
ncbi:nucleoside triphosphate pyrophosphohydrolase [Ferruginibacter yonginensis]|uniref:Nucleoside triphosphate pyrophosphohydrolase n=1 Tax=Ferruginibacter yonginensis TaxID=1310416 RepID=A0ABV8QVA6_9BACT